MYIITLDKQVQNLFINGTQAGSMCINDTIMQYSSKKNIRNIFLGLNVVYLLSLFIMFSNNIVWNSNILKF